MSLEDLSSHLSKAKWQDEEDGDEDIKDNWDDEDETPAPPPPTESKKAGGAKSKKGATKGADSAGASGKPLTAQELRDKRLAEEKMLKDSELKLTQQMLGMEDKDIALEFPLETKEDFDKFYLNLVCKLRLYEKSPHYYLLVDRLVREICTPLESDELKNMSAALNALFNEKVKSSKAKPKKKAAKGLALKVERDFDNLDRNNDYGEDIDDFM